MTTTTGRVIRPPLGQSLYEKIDNVRTAIALTFKREPVTRANWPTDETWNQYFGLMAELEKELVKV
ncbi:MAG: hypothetical protein ABSG67_11400 [Thermoguttaceae bacterium]|jgi:hypothetical protein